MRRGVWPCSPTCTGTPWRSRPCSRSSSASEPDAIVHCGDLTWGPLPAATAELLERRDVLLRPRQRRPCRDGARGAARPTRPPTLTPRERWMAGAARRVAAAPARAPSRRPSSSRSKVSATSSSATARRGATRSSSRSRRPRRASPTPSTACRRDVVVTAHTHVRYERRALGRTFLNPGSVGMPYEGAPGAYWALLGPGIEHRRTDVRPRRGGAPLPRRAEIRWRTRWSTSCGDPRRRQR